MTKIPSCPICGDAGTCDVCDNPPMTAEEIANLKPFAGVLPGLAARLRETGEKATGQRGGGSGTGAR